MNYRGTRVLTHCHVMSWGPGLRARLHRNSRPPCRAHQPDAVFVRCFLHLLSVDLRFWTMTLFKKINEPSNDKLSTISPKHGWYKPSNFGSLVLGLPHHSCSSFQVMLRHVSAQCSCLICYQIPVIAAKSSAKAHHVVTAASSLLQIAFGSRFSNTFGV